MEECIVADVARQAHPVRTRAVGRGAAEERRCLADAQVERWRMVDPGAPVTLERGREVVEPVLQERELVRFGRRRRWLHQLGLVGVVVERRQRHEERPVALRDGAAARGHRAPVAHAFHGHLDRLVGDAGLYEVRVQRVGSQRAGSGSVDGRTRREERLRDRLAAEHAGEAVGLRRREEPVVACGRELERAEQTVERGADRAGRGRTARASWLPRTLRDDDARGSAVLQDEKILITGPAGRIAFGLARSLVADNDVWGIARFSDPSTRDKVEALGVTTRTLDLADGDFGDLPDRLHVPACTSWPTSAPTTTTARSASTPRAPASCSSTAATRRRRW